jgi:hypothetical protein
MKKILLTFMAFSLAVSFTSCLKDKGYENNEYGFNDVDKSPKGVSLPEASKRVNFQSIVSSSTPTSLQLVFVNLSSGQVAAEDVHVNLVPNATLVADYNADPTTNPKLSILPPSLYTLSPVKVTIPKGATSGKLMLNIPNPSLIDASKNYGFGYSIGSVDEPGYTIAANAKNVLAAINIKNIYDATYDVTGYFFHPTAPRGIDMEKTLATLSPTSCATAVGDLGGAGFLFNFSVTGTTLGGWNLPAGAATPAPPASNFMTADNPGAIVYTGITPGTNGYLQTTYNNTYNASTKTFYMHYGYGVGSTGQNGYSRNIYEKWVRQ